MTVGHLSPHGAAGIGSSAVFGSIRRILVAVDASPSSLQALAAAARVAALLQAELEGLFVEDTDLLSFAELPFSVVTAAHMSSARRVGRAEIERTLRQQARRALEAMRKTSSEAGIRWSFRVVRGNVHRELMQAASQADLFSLGCIGLSAARRRSGGSVAHHAARLAPRSVLILRQNRPPIDAAVVAVARDGEPSPDVLENAVLLARATGQPLVVALPGQAAEWEAFRKKAAELIARWDVVPSWLTPEGVGPRAHLAEAVRRAQGGTLVLESEHPLIQEEQIERLIDRSGCSLLIVRARRAAP